MLNRIRFRKLSVALAAAIVVGASTAGAALVHSKKLPEPLANLNKDTATYMYLEGEAAAEGATDTLADSRDKSRTYYRTATDSQHWGTVTADDARFANRGQATSQKNRNVYWENIASPLPAGRYDMYVLAWLADENRAQKFTLFGGKDRASVDYDAAIPLGTVEATVTGSTNAAWYKIGTVDLAASISTFRLSVDTTNAPPRFDTVLFVRVP